MSLSDDIAELQDGFEAAFRRTFKSVYCSFLICSGTTGRQMKRDNTTEKRSNFAAKHWWPGSRDGLLMTELGQSLNGEDKDSEREQLWRKAVLASPKEWRCWVCLGSSLQAKVFATLIPEPFRNQVENGNFEALESSGYQPSPEALKDAGELSSEAADAYQHAMTVAPAEYEVYIQHAGYLAMVSLCGSCNRYFRDHEKPTSSSAAAQRLPFPNGGPG